MKFPSFYNPANAGEWSYEPDQAAIFDQAAPFRADQGIKPALSDRHTTTLLGIDLQKDFCFPQGTLYVGGRSGSGAIDDSRRIAEFIYTNMSLITKMELTFDTHVPFQIFFPSFWVNDNDQHPSPHTMIYADDIRNGKYRPNPAAAHLCGGNYQWLCKQVLDYCEKLEKAGKYVLYIWPIHCLIGSSGYSLVGVVHEATLFHSYVRGFQRSPQIKGLAPFTENYSVFSPEVTLSHDGLALGNRNVNALKTLIGSDNVIIVGQAASHCVKSSIDDLLTEITATDPDLARKCYVVRDAMSSVAVPDGKGGFVFDFTADAEAAFDKYEAAGMNIVSTTTDVHDWPGFKA